jgi:hypothetical protein
MSGIFYDPGARALRRVKDGHARAEWALVTHSLTRTENQLRRIMREWLPNDVIQSVDFSVCREDAA